MQLLRTNTATRVTVGPFFDKTDGVTPEVAITVTAEKLTFIVDTGGVPTLILDVAPTASLGANDMVHITGDDAGYYDLELTAVDVNYLGRAKLALTDATVHCPVFHEYMIIPAMIYDALVLGTDVLQADVTQLLGTAWLTPAVAGTPDVNAKQIGGTAQTGNDVGADVDAILVDTIEIGVAGAGLTAINLPDQIMNITGNVTGNLSGSIGSVTGAVGSVTGNVSGSIGSLAAQAKADVNAEVVDVMNVDTIAELAQAIPSATPTHRQAIMLLYMAFRNKLDVDANNKEVHNDAGTVVCKKALTDNGTTYSEAEMVAGP